VTFLGSTAKATDSNELDGKDRAVEVPSSTVQ
jgi:hypothetical protein